MPKLTRKFPTKQKTTTINGNREYRKLQQREFREKKAAKDKTFKEDLSVTEMQFQKDYEALRRFQSKSLDQAARKKAENAGKSFEKMIDAETHNNFVFSLIDNAFLSHVKMMDLTGTFSPEQKQAWIDGAKNVKEMIKADQFTAFQLGEKLGIKIIKSEEKKTNE